MDALSGEMQRQREETGSYRPDFTPFGGYDNPIETRTWWGKQLRGLVHFGSLAAGTLLTAKAAAATGIVALPAGLIALLKVMSYEAWLLELYLIFYLKSQMNKML